MPDFSMSNLAAAFSITLAAGLFTVLGSGLVMFSKTPNPRVLSFGLAFAGGAMVYVSLTEIFSKSSEAFAEIYDKDHAFAAATMAFLAGMGGIALIDRLVPNPHETLDAQDPSFQESKRRHIARVGMMAAFAITAHNFPEGLATFFATLENPAVGMPLALAIAIHNIPEGISIAAPVYFATRSRKKTVWACLLSGLAEPLGAALGYLVLQPFLSPAVFGSVFGVGRAAAGRQTLFRRPRNRLRPDNGHGGDCRQPGIVPFLKPVCQRPSEMIQTAFLRYNPHIKNNLNFTKFHHVRQIQSSRNRIQTLSKLGKAGLFPA